ncbi:MAG: hypothetical protein V1750_04745, partial [Acidobacteriota bacterium]
MRWLLRLAGLLGALGVLLVRATSRVRFHNDHRAGFRAEGRAYAYAFLHAHQLATVVASDP